MTTDGAVRLPTRVIYLPPTLGYLNNCFTLVDDAPFDCCNFPGLAVYECQTIGWERRYRSDLAAVQRRRLHNQQRTTRR